MGKLHNYLTKGLSNHIEEDDGMRLCHALFRYGLETTCLAYKDVLETERSETKKKRLCEELEKAKMELAVGAEREKQLTTRAGRGEILRIGIEREMNESAAAYYRKIHKLEGEVERAKNDLRYSSELLAKKAYELAQKDVSWVEEKEKILDDAQSDLLYSIWLQSPNHNFNFLGPYVIKLIENFRAMRDVGKIGARQGEGTS
ncbi:hypothetical protein ACOSP7_018899 [Xanthoceras sorbifolium]